MKNLQEMTDNEFDQWLHDTYWQVAAADAEQMEHRLFPDGVPAAAPEELEAFKTAARCHGINI